MPPDETMSVAFTSQGWDADELTIRCCGPMNAYGDDEREWGQK
jgi:hypothetical protein